MISPSPWSVSEKRVYVKDADGENVCAVSRHDDCALIAAAPELLAACKALMLAIPNDALLRYESLGRYFGVALDAIEKAEGR